MRFWIGSLLAMLLMAVPLTAGDKKTEDKTKDREQQFKELQASFEKARQEAFQAYQAAVLKLVEDDPKDDLAFRLLSRELLTARGHESKVFALLAEHHLKKPAMADVCRRLSSRPSAEAAELLRKVLNDSPDKSARSCACYALAQLADNEAIRDPSKAAEAEKLYARVVEEFADVKSVRSSTLGELAKTKSKLLIGKPAPEITSENLKGDKIHLKDLRGKVVVLDIWTTWCGPCRAMIPHEREMVEKLKDKPFALVSISFDQEKDIVKKFLDKEAMPWTHWWNGPEGGIAKDWHITHFPTIYVLDAKGVIRYKEIRGKQLEDAVEKLLAEGKDKK